MKETRQQLRARPVSEAHVANCVLLGIVNITSKRWILGLSKGMLTVAETEELVQSGVTKDWSRRWSACSRSWFWKGRHTRCLLCRNGEEDDPARGQSAFLWV